jgi:SAM-dependent methyltransferase
MENTPFNDTSHYDELVARQVEQYRDTEIMHDMPPIFSYWATKHIAPVSAEIIGYDSTVGFYTGYFSKSLHESDSNFLVSIGAGDCSIEIEIAKALLARGEKDFHFICLEISPLSVEKARKKIDAEKLNNIITVAQTDINKWDPEHSFAGVMAHHSLHHILDLESLFALIKKKLAPKGRFLTGDIIGRNGHMRWPEALLLVRKIWEKLPRKYKFGHQLNRYDEYFENWDCSAEGFEGIRAQDILPLLVKNFSFEVFRCYGNIIDTFVNRNFGPNYDPANPSDAAFIDYLQDLDDTLISAGIIKPTNIIAVMTNENAGHINMYKHWSPAFAVRDPALPAPVYDIAPLLEDIPYELSPADNPPLGKQVHGHLFSKKIHFGAGSNGPQYLKYGWHAPEKDFAWSIGEAAAILIPIGKITSGHLTVKAEFIPYPSTVYDQTIVEVLVNETLVKTLQYTRGEITYRTCTEVISIPAHLVGDSMEITFLLPNRRQPQFESGNDLRTLGIALVSVTIAAPLIGPFNTYLY